MPRDRAALGRGVGPKVDHDLVHETPAPTIWRIIALDDRMLRGVKVLGRVLARRLVTTADIAAVAANAQVKLRLAELQAVLAADGARAYRSDPRQVSASGSH